MSRQVGIFSVGAGVGAGLAAQFADHPAVAWARSLIPESLGEKISVVGATMAEGKAAQPASAGAKGAGTAVVAGPSRRPGASLLLLLLLLLGVSASQLSEGQLQQLKQSLKTQVSKAKTRVCGAFSGFLFAVQEFLECANVWLAFGEVGTSRRSLS